MSCMLKPAVPSAVAMSCRRVRAVVAKPFHASRKVARAGAGAAKVDVRGSCFQSAAQLRTIVTTAAP